MVVKAAEPVRRKVDDRRPHKPPLALCTAYPRRERAHVDGVDGLMGCGISGVIRKDETEASKRKTKKTRSEKREKREEERKTDKL